MQFFKFPDTIRAGLFDTSGRHSRTLAPVQGLLIHQFLPSLAKKMVKVLPSLAMLAICMVIAITIAMSKNDILAVGLSLFGVVICHNTVGFLLGYWGARATGLGETDSRTVAIEVGIHNGGMATGLAFNVLKSAQAALGSAIFGPWSAVSGTALASWWRQHPGKEPAAVPEFDEEKEKCVEVQ